MQNPAADSRPTMLSDADMDDAEVLAPIGAAGATPTVGELEERVFARSPKVALKF